MYCQDGSVLSGSHPSTFDVPKLSFQLLRSDDSPSYQPQFVPQPHLTAVLLTFNQGDPQNDLTNCRTGVLLIVGR